MKNEDKLLDVIGELDEALIPEMPVKETAAKTEGKASSKKNGRHHGKAFWIELGIAAAAVILVVSIALPKVLYKGKNKNGKMLLAEPVYPEMAQCPDDDFEARMRGDFDSDQYHKQFDEWVKSQEEFKEQPAGYDAGLKEFLGKSTSAFMEETGDKENFVYSPLSLYMTMSMAAEATGGNTRDEILDFLGVPDMDTLRKNTKSLFLANYMDDGNAMCLLANSLWLSDRFDYKSDTVERLATEYYSSVFSGDPEDEVYQQELRNWINRQTDGLLSDYADELNMDQDMLLMLASTINYSGQWRSRFNKDKTEEGVFHTRSGDITCDFMYTQSEFDCKVCDEYIMVELPLVSNGKMRLILPNYDKTVKDLLSNEEFIAFLNDPRSGGNSALVDLTVPKFDVSYKNDMIDELKKLGIRDAFDPDKGDFSSVIDQGSKDVYVNRVEQDVRVMIDEQGCKGAAVTVMSATATAGPSRHYQLDFDRPFVFEVFSDTGAPLFVGVVNNPNE